MFPLSSIWGNYNGVLLRHWLNSDSVHVGHTVDYEIALAPGFKLFSGSIYNLSKSELQYLKEYIDRMLVRGWIHLSEFLFSSPILFIKKSDGSLYLVIDYWKLNEITIKNSVSQASNLRTSWLYQ